MLSELKTEAEEPTNHKAQNRTLSLVYSSASACDSDNAVFIPTETKQDQCSASDVVGFIFTRLYRSTLLITTPTTTPSVVKANLNHGSSVAGRVCSGIPKL